MEYTIEQFEIDYNNSYSVESKRQVLEKALDNLDIFDDTVKETLRSYKEDFKDLHDEMKSEEDKQCNYDIETGIAQLYVCKKDFTDSVNRNFNKGTNYYIKIDDVKSKYVPKDSEDDIPDFIKDYVSGIKPLIYIYTDNGIGTQKSKNILFTDEDFDDLFQKATGVSLS